MYAIVDSGILLLVVISHGDGGWFGGLAALGRGLAEAAMIAVALNLLTRNSSPRSGDNRASGPDAVAGLMDGRISDRLVFV